MQASAFERERETLYQERATLKQRLEECCQQLRGEQEARNKSLRESSRVSETLVGERASLEKRLLDLGREKHQVQLQLSTTQGKMAALETQLASVTGQCCHVCTLLVPGHFEFLVGMFQARSDNFEYFHIFLQ